MDTADTTRRPTETLPGSFTGPSGIVLAEIIRGQQAARARVQSAFHAAFECIQVAVRKTTDPTDPTRVVSVVNLAKEALEAAMRAEWKTVDEGLGVVLSEAYARTHANLDQWTLHMDPHYGAGEESVEGALVTDPGATLVVFADQGTTAAVELSLLHSQSIDTVIPAKESRRGRPKRAAAAAPATAEPDGTK